MLLASSYVYSMDIRRYFASVSSGCSVEPAANDSAGDLALPCESEESVSLRTYIGSEHGGGSTSNPTASSSITGSSDAFACTTESTEVGDPMVTDLL